MVSKDLKRINKYLSLLLRHKPEKENLEMDSYGYVKVKELCGALKISRKELDDIVESDNKNRFSYSKDGKKIRANQGHSFPVDLELMEIHPPNVLFHGTSYDNKKSITDNGITKQKRTHVHLSMDVNTACDVGLRYAKKREKLWLIAIDAKHMFDDGYKFYLSKNNVFLTDNVPSKYFIHNYFKS